MHIVKYPHPVLRYASRPVERIDDELRAAVREMFTLMYEARGIGLAANQVGLPFRFFVLNITADPEQKDEELVFINPEIVKRHSWSDEEEGCLSIPSVYSKVRRPKRIRIQAFGLDGRDIDLEADDLLGRAIQHETDHLDGKLFIDYLGPLTRHGIKGKIREFEAEYKKAQAEGIYASDEKIIEGLKTMAAPTLAAVDGPAPAPTPAPADV
ncbi:peptide deformylase [Paludisphaera rhizosphaerae]|uniref:peptide deformylase n=1 Tax=Paludisphaera rhizosphaerae TaxID=2711216 RepID=UPI0013EDCB82|nr:peptide deformylase [Paludisphaera rhizosphaerae]